MITHDQLASFRRFRTLKIVDELSRESPTIEVDTSLPWSTSGQSIGTDRASNAGSLSVIGAKLLTRHLLRTEM